MASSQQSMLASFGKLTELKQRLLFVIGALIVFRLGSFIPIPGVNPDEIRDMQDEVIRVPVYEEQAQLHKQARVTEEVTVGKKAVEEQQTLSGTVRHEHVEVVNDGDVQVRGDVTGQNQDAYTQDQR